MKDVVRQTRSHLMSLFERHGFNPRTDLGQNFLIDLNIVEFVVRHGDLGERDVVLEVGAGTGGMTSFLSQDAGDVISVELDPNMFQLATEATTGMANVTLLNCDALKSKSRIAPAVLDEIAAKLGQPGRENLKLVANLPYNIATPLVSNLVATDLPWSRMVITIQLELAERMAALPGTSDYGSLSVWLQAQSKVKILRTLRPQVFWPRPKVNSAIVRIIPDESRREKIIDRAFFLDFLRRLFALRRKFLRGVVAGMYRKQVTKLQIDAVLEELGFEEGERAEQVPVDRLVALSNKLQDIAIKPESA